MEIQCKCNKFISSPSLQKRKRVSLEKKKQAFNQDTFFLSFSGVKGSNVIVLSNAQELHFSVVDSFIQFRQWECPMHCQPLSFLRASAQFRAFPAKYSIISWESYIYSRGLGQRERVKGKLGIGQTRESKFVLKQLYFLQCITRTSTIIGPSSSEYDIFRFRTLYKKSVYLILRKLKGGNRYRGTRKDGPARYSVITE